MKRIFELLFAGTILISSFGLAEAGETINLIIRDSPSKIVCEIAPRDGAAKSYAIFHLMGFNDKGDLRYRGITANLVEIRIASDGKLISDRTPCLTDLVPFP